MTDPSIPTPTPPVIETGLPTGTTDWDGVERRRTDPLALAIRSAVSKVENGKAPPVQTNFVTTIVAIAAILALQCLILVSQFRLADRINDSNIEQQHFRESIVCFLVESTRQAEEAAAAGRPPVGAGTKILTTCGFVTTPGNKGD